MGGCVECEYLKNIRFTLEKINTNIHNERIIDIGDVGGFDTLYQTADSKIRLIDTMGERSVEVVELEEADLESVYHFLDANWRTVESRETLVEHKAADELEWESEPLVVEVEDEVIGIIGEYIAETVEDRKLIGIRFVSPDGTYATLTMYGSDEEKEKQLSKTDLKTLGEALMRFGEKL